MASANQAYDRRFTVEAKTASYTCTQADSGKLFTNRGDTDAITFTLPAVSSTFTGVSYRFLCVADFDFAVASTADEMVTFNCNAATSVKLGTTSEKIGGGFEAVCDGTSWLVFPLTEETQTVTVA